jgi:hypothetical protein
MDRQDDVDRQDDLERQDDVDRKDDMELPPEYDGSMLEQRVPSPIHLKDDDRVRLLA